MPEIHKNNDSVIAQPNVVEQANLPTQVFGRIDEDTGSDVRIKWYDENFTQSGEDLPSSKWHGSYTTGTDPDGRTSFIGNGTDAYINADLKLPRNEIYFSLSFRLRTTSTGSGERIISIKDTRENIRWLDIYLDNGKLKVVFEKFNTGEVIKDVESGPAINDGQWHEFDLFIDNRYSGQPIILLIDGASAFVVNQNLTYGYFGNEPCHEFFIGAERVSGSMTNFMDAEISALRYTDALEGLDVFGSDFLPDIPDEANRFNAPYASRRELFSHRNADRGSRTTNLALFGEGANNKYCNVKQNYYHARESFKADTFIGVSCNARCMNFTSDGSIVHFLYQNPNESFFEVDSYTLFEIGVVQNIFFLKMQGPDGNIKHFTGPTIFPFFWNHIFVYFDLTEGVNGTPHLFFDGSEYSLTTVLDETINELRISETMLIGGHNSYSLGQGNEYTSFDGEISDFYVSNNPEFKNHVSDYYRHLQPRLFDRGSWERKEHFTYGEDDDDCCVVGDWRTYSGSGPVQIEAQIGKGMDTRGEGYMNLQYRLPNIMDDTFLGVSFRFKINANQTANWKRLLWINEDSWGVTKGVLDIYWANDNIECYSWENSGGAVKGTIANNISKDEWHHLFLYTDYAAADKGIKLWIDGTSYTGWDNSTRDKIYRNNHSTAYIGTHEEGTPDPEAPIDMQICDFYFTTNPNFQYYEFNYRYLPIGSVY